MSPNTLLQQVYDELRRLAAAQLAREAPGNTLDATALVHEAYLRLANASVDWQDKTHFLRTAALAMRRILVDQARAKRAAKRGGAAARVALDPTAPPPPDDLPALGEALEKLAALKPDHAELVSLRFFAGLTGDEAAVALGFSPATADRMWRYARAWLRLALDTDPP